MRVRIRITLLVTAATLATATSARASTYCVHQSGSCPSGSLDQGSSLQSALDAASAHAGADAVAVLPGVYDVAPGSSGFGYSGADPITITAPQSGVLLRASTVTPTVGGSGVILGVSGGSGSVVDGLSFSLPSNAFNHNASAFPTTALIMAGGIARHVTVTGAADQGAAGAVGIDDAGQVQDSAITLADPNSLAVSATSQGLSVVRSDLRAAVGVVNYVADVTTTVANDRIRAKAGVDVATGTLHVADTLVDGSGQSFLAGITVRDDGISANSAHVDLTGVTVVGTGAAGDNGILVYSDRQAFHVDMAVSGTIITRAAHSTYSTAPFAPTGTITYSDAGAPAFGPALTAGAGVTSADPQFVNAAAGDFRLAVGSPLLDAGDPAPLTNFGEDDAAGLPRMADADGDGAARRDIGAFERQPSVTWPVAGNLLVNGDAEQGTPSVSGATPAAAPGWIAAGPFGELAYGLDAFLPVAVATALHGDGGYFAAGPAATSQLTQRVTVSDRAAIIDAGAATAHLSGLLGGFGNDADTGTVSATFLDGREAPLGTPLTIGPVTAAQRSRATTLLARSAAVAVPHGTRVIRVTLSGTRATASGDDDAYFDDLALTVDGTLPPPPGTTPPGPAGPTGCPAGTLDCGMRPPEGPAAPAAALKRIRFHRTKARLALRCPATNRASCVVKASLLVSRGRRRTHATAATGRVTIAPGRTGTLVLRLGPTGRRVVRTGRTTVATLALETGGVPSSRHLLVKVTRTLR